MASHSKKSVLTLLPECVIGMVIGAISVSRIIDTNWWLFVVPLGLALIGAIVAVWRINRYCSTVESVHLRGTAIRWSVVLLITGPSAGFVFAAVAMARGAARPFHMAVFAILGLIAGGLIAVALLVIAGLLYLAEKQHWTKKGDAAL